MLKNCIEVIRSGSMLLIPPDVKIYFRLSTLLLNFAVSLVQFKEVKGAQSRFAHIEKFSLNFSNSSFVIRVNLLHT